MSYSLGNGSLVLTGRESCETKRMNNSHDIIQPVSYFFTSPKRHPHKKRITKTG